MATQLRLPDVWRFELAAMLSQIGCVTLLPETLEKVHSCQSLTPDEAHSFALHPQVAASLLSNIPRLEGVAQMIALQQVPSRRRGANPQTLPEDQTILGGCMLRVALDFDQMISAGVPKQEALTALRAPSSECHPALVATLENLDVEYAEMEPAAVSIKELRSHMVLAEDVRTRDGLLLVSRGQEVTFPVIERLRSFAESRGIVEPIRVLVPRPECGPG